jgi:hypothetical protein
MTILKSVLRTQGVNVWTGFTGLRIGSSGGLSYADMPILEGMYMAFYITAKIRDN